MLPGTLFLFAAIRAAGADDAALALARGLFNEGSWQECRTEAARCLVSRPENREAALLKASAERRAGLDAAAALRELHAAADVSESIRRQAAYELARALWEEGKTAEALPLFREVFDSADNSDIFLKAACSISLILRDNKKLAREHDGLRLQVRTCYPLFTPELREACAPPGPRSGWPTRPAEWAIRFYQTQISGAIGARCSLVPSCSRYAVQAMRRHGLLGLAMYADRGYREPDIVARKRTVIVSNGVLRIADPVDDHDWWMKGADR